MTLNPWFAMRPDFVETCILVFQRVNRLSLKLGLKFPRSLHRHLFYLHIMRYYTAAVCFGASDCLKYSGNAVSVSGVNHALKNSYVLSSLRDGYILRYCVIGLFENSHSIIPRLLIKFMIRKGVMLLYYWNTCRVISNLERFLLKKSNFLELIQFLGVNLSNNDQFNGSVFW